MNSYARVWFGNTDEKPDVQQLLLLEMMTVADGGGDALFCFSWLLFHLNLPAPEKGPKTEKEDKMEKLFKTENLADLKDHVI